MRCRCIHAGLVVGCMLLVAVALSAARAGAQSDAELKALNQRAIELHRAGKIAKRSSSLETSPLPNSQAPRRRAPSLCDSDRFVGPAAARHQPPRRG